MSRILRSVGIDLGTTTTQLIFSELTVKNESAACAVPNYAIAEKRVIYRSAAYFTPLLSERELDAEGIRRIVAQEYARAGMTREAIHTGAVIITGETARRENARQVLQALSDFAGDFVVATAGPALESVLSGKGAGAAEASERERRAILNLDIGGGTTNFSLFDCGALRSTGCVNIGGRLVKLEKDGTVRHISPVLAPYVSFAVGERLPAEDLAPTAQMLAELLEEAVGLREKSARLAHFVTDRLPEVTGTPLLSFSGGVADLIERSPPDPFAYGDLGVLLGRAIRESRLCAGQWRLGTQTLRATVIGAGCHTLTLSGSTVSCVEAALPLKNLPVACIEGAPKSSDELCAAARAALALYPEESPALYLRGVANPSYAALSQLADGLARALAHTALPVVIVLEDIAKALGQALSMRLKRPVLCLDGIALSAGSYLDIGLPVADGAAVAVAVKTILFQ